MYSGAFPDICRLFWRSFRSGLTEVCLLRRINSKAAFFILKAGAKNIVDGGKLITIVTSLLGAFTGLYTSYAGSKAPVEHFTRGVAKELQGRSVSVNAIAPGPMDTRKLTTSCFLIEPCYIANLNLPGLYSILLPARDGRCRRIPQEHGHREQAYRHQGHRPYC